MEKKRVKHAATVGIPQCSLTIYTAIFKNDQFDIWTLTFFLPFLQASELIRRAIWEWL